MSGLDMRALYYIPMRSGRDADENEQTYEISVKSSENNLNQNFSILTKKLGELEVRLLALEQAQQGG